MMRVSDFIIKFFVDKGISHIFLVSGGGIMHLLDGLACNKKISYICAHNEAAAAVFAEGYARITNSFGVLFVTTGPGGTNAVTGIVDAWVDSVPVIVISGQCKRSQNVHNSGLSGLRSLGGQEVNILPIVQSFTKYSEMVNDPEMIRFHLEKALFHAKEGRPGPSWLDIPLDVQAAVIDETNLIPFIAPVITNKSEKSSFELNKIQSLIQKSKRPVIIAGHGIRLSSAQDLFLELLDLIKIPVVASKLGQDLIEFSNPYYVGFGGTKGTRAGNFAIQNADLIISIGSRLAIPFTGYDYQYFADKAKIIAVDIDETELKKNTVRIDYPICTDAKEFIFQLIQKIKNEPVNEKKEWIKKCRDWKKRFSPINEVEKNDKGYLTFYHFFNKISECLPKNSVVIADAGTVYCIVSQAFLVKKGQRVVTPAALGTMGLSLPLAIGAYYGNPDSTIVAVTGDGSLQMNIQELQTLIHYDIPVKLFVNNNQGYLSIRNTQNSYFEGRFCGSSSDSGVSCPDLEKISFAYGIRYVSIRNKNELDEKINDVLNFSHPIICEVFTDPTQQIIPSVSSRVLPDGSMVSCPLDDMWPFLEKDELENERNVDRRTKFNDHSI